MSFNASALRYTDICTVELDSLQDPQYIASIVILERQHDLQIDARSAHPRPIGNWLWSTSSGPGVGFLDITGMTK